MINKEAIRSDRYALPRPSAVFQHHITAVARKQTVPWRRRGRRTWAGRRGWPAARRRVPWRAPGAAGGRGSSRGGSAPPAASRAGARAPPWSCRRRCACRSWCPGTPAASPGRCSWSPAIETRVSLRQIRPAARTARVRRCLSVNRLKTGWAQQKKEIIKINKLIHNNSWKKARKTLQFNTWER